MKTHTHKYMYIYKFKQNLWNIFFLPNFTEISRLKNRGKFAAAFDLVCRPMCEYNDGTIESTTRIRIRNCLAYIYICMLPMMLILMIMMNAKHCKRSTALKLRTNLTSSTRHAPHRGTKQCWNTSKQRVANRSRGQQHAPPCESSGLFCCCTSTWICC